MLGQVYLRALKTAISLGTSPQNGKMAMSTRCCYDIFLLRGHLEPSWGHLGRTQGHLGPSWGHLGGTWGHLGAILRPSWASRRAPELPKTVIFLWFLAFLYLYALGFIIAIVKLLLAFLGPSWAILGPSWGHPGPFWGHPGVHLGSSWSHLGASWGYLGAILGHLRPSWGHLRAS